MKTIANIIHNKTFPLRIHNDQWKELYFENSVGYWCKYKYDNKGNGTYYENSYGDIDDSRI